VAHIVEKNYYLRDKTAFAVLFIIIVVGSVLSIAKEAYTSLPGDDGLANWMILFLGLILLLIFVTPFLAGRFLRIDQGRYGERVILKILKSLPDEYTVFHSVQLPGRRSDIDFVVVGPTGIFAIEVKSHRNRRYFNLSKFLQQAYGSGIKLKHYLEQHTHQKIWVNTLLVFSSERLQWHHAGTYRNVYVLSKEDLLSYISLPHQPFLDYEKVVKLL
jgi:Nuclease-related domain